VGKNGVFVFRTNLHYYYGCVGAFCLVRTRRERVRESSFFSPSFTTCECIGRRTTTAITKRGHDSHVKNDNFGFNQNLNKTTPIIILDRSFIGTRIEPRQMKTRITYHVQDKDIVRYSVETVKYDWLYFRNVKKTWELREFFNYATPLVIMMLSLYMFQFTMLFTS